MAIPAFNKVRATSQKNVVTNNLRQISSAADQYFLETGFTTVAYTDLVGSGKYISQLNKAGSEDYAAAFGTITLGYTSLTISVPALAASVGYDH